MADITPSRQEKSLGLLTSKFVSLLQEAEDGVLDIKSVSLRNMLGILLSKTREKVGEVNRSSKSPESF